MDESGGLAKSFGFAQDPSKNPERNRGTNEVSGVPRNGMTREKPEGFFWKGA